MVDLNEQNNETSNNNELDNIVGFNVEDVNEVSKDTESIFRGDVNEKDNVGMETNQQDLANGENTASYRTNNREYKEYRESNTRI